MLIILIMTCYSGVQAQQALKIRNYFDPGQKKHIREEYSVIKKDTSLIKNGDYKRYTFAGKIVEFATYDNGRLIRKHLVRHDDGKLKEISYYQPNGDYWMYTFKTDSLQKNILLGYESNRRGIIKNKLEIPDQKLIVDSLLKTMDDRGMKRDSRIISFLKTNDFNIESVYMNAGVNYKNKKDWQWQYDRNNQVIYLLMTTIEDYVPLKGRKIETRDIAKRKSGY